jgi:hypothetical protein
VRPGCKEVNRGQPHKGSNRMFRKLPARAYQTVFSALMAFS